MHSDPTLWREVEVRPSVHTSDAAAALLLALGSPSGTWNIVDDDPATGHEGDFPPTGAQV